MLRPSMPRHEKALADLQSAGEQVKAYIQQGAQTFDQVDQYAESSWHDIKGNGTEAQKAADRAHALWQQATALNALTQILPRISSKPLPLSPRPTPSLTNRAS